jgi:hypothetical protein
MMRTIKWIIVLALVAGGRIRAADPIDETSLRLPMPGDYSLQVISPSWLEISVIDAPDADAKPLDLAEHFHREDFQVEVDGAATPVDQLAFKRRALYAPLKQRDLRVANYIYLHVASPLADGAHEVKVTVKDSPLWSAKRMFAATTDPRRYSPAIHVNQEGYVPDMPKLAYVGYYLGTAGELDLGDSAGFDIVDAKTGTSALHGTLRIRRDVGFQITPLPYQSVYEADFSALKTEGTYQLVVAGLGASLPFRIDAGELMNFTRAYALGLYHQRCGAANELPYSRFTHGPCHVTLADIPVPEDQFPKAWKIIADLEKDVVKPEHPELQLRSPQDQLYPFVRHGKIDVSGGHHDAGDYSKYTTNSASLIHALMFAVDSLPGVAELDNLGLPESGDGVSDVMQEAKWESDFLSKLQDSDGGFYFLVYPRDRRYETDVLPDHGDPQIVWPKTTAATAAAVAALAQCASSPAFKKQYPDVAKRYFAQAERGWKFLEDAIALHGKRGAYQRLTHYGDTFEHNDELAWAAVEMFVATGDLKYEKRLLEWYPNPADPQTWHYGWQHAAFAYGNALRSYAFAASSGRLPSNKLNHAYLTKCEAELRRAGEDALKASEQNAYGVSYPLASKRIARVGWFFPSDEAFDMTVAYQLQRRPAYVTAILANLNYEAGCNPVNRVFFTGLGVRRQREIVSQYAHNDDRVLPPSGIPLGSLQSSFYYMSLYKTQLRDLSWPNDDGNAMYPLYDRWTDSYNLDTEFVVVNQGRSLASLAFWAAQTPVKTQRWKSASAKIVGPTGTLPLDRPATFHLECPDLDLRDARIVWEGRDQEPAFGDSFTMIPRSSGRQWVEAEAALPDGRRVVARTEFKADAPVVFWVDGAVPAGASTQSEGGDNWQWITAASKPTGLAAHASKPQHESALANGIHEHGFYHADATLTVERGDILFAYIFIDPNHPPKTIMLEWNDGSNEHRAFWGKNEIPYGKMNTESQRPMGPLPPAGRWVRLEVPAKAVGLEGRTLTGMVFRLHSGRARWDAAGKMKANATALPPEPSTSDPEKT